MNSIGNWFAGTMLGKGAAVPKAFKLSFIVEFYMLRWETQWKRLKACCCTYRLDRNELGKRIPFVNWKAKFLLEGRPICANSKLI